MDRLVRVSNGKMIGGVCTGIARRYSWDVNVVRVGFVASCLFPGPQFVIYLALWLVIPMDKQQSGTAAA